MKMRLLPCREGSGRSIVSCQARGAVWYSSGIVDRVYRQDGFAGREAGEFDVVHGVNGFGKASNSLSMRRIP